MIKKYILSCIVFIGIASSLMAQKSSEAASILDNTASAFEKAGGVKAEFTFEAFQRGASLGTASGAIELDGEKFFLKTAEHLSWYDGKTQWTYLPSSDEVTITTPTEAELQSINPYALLYIYKNGYNYEMGKTQSFQGKAVHEVVLKSFDKHNQISSIMLLVDQSNYQPLYIVVELSDFTRNEITINQYQIGMKYSNSKFVFDKKQYPNVEVIDIR